MITKYGYDVFFTLSALCAAIVLISYFIVQPALLKYSAIGLAVVFWGFAVNFFRDPERVPPSGDHLVIAPADGEVILIKLAAEPEFMKVETTQISIFMSPLNVHVNRNPVTGTVEYFRYVKGQYFAAFEDKASDKNEQTIIGIQSSKGKVLFKQIAGFVARRIVCDLKIGDEVKAGERFGMIKFGSRVDVFIPADAAIKVQLGEKTAAGETVLAELQ